MEKLDPQKRKHEVKTAVRSLTPTAIRAAERHLTQACAVMARLMVAHGRCGLAERDQQHFRTLANSIMGQQLSAKAAAKIRSVRHLAERVTDGRLDLTMLAELTDEEAIAELTAVSGIGRWTAEMFLIFGLKRPNVLALRDAGLRRAACLLYGDEATLEALGKLWAPYCSVASWYLWRHLDASAQPI